MKIQVYPTFVSRIELVFLYKVKELLIYFCF